MDRRILTAVIFGSMLKIERAEKIRDVDFQDVLGRLRLSVRGKRLLQGIPARARRQEHARAIGFSELMAERATYICFGCDDRRGLIGECLVK